MQKQNLFAEKASPKIKTSQEIAFDWNCIIRKAPGATYDKEYKDYTKKRNKKWVRLEDAQQEIEDCRVSWQNLKDTIQKFDAKIAYLEQQLKHSEELVETWRGEWKQKLQQLLDDFPKFASFDHVTRKFADEDPEVGLWLLRFKVLLE